MRKTLLTLLVSATALVAGCRSNAGQGPAVTELAPQNLRAVWTRSVDMKDAQARVMYVRGNLLLVYTTDNMLYRFDRKSGDVQFLTRMAQRGVSVKAPAVLNDSAVVPTEVGLQFFDKRGYPESMLKVPDPIRSGVVADKSGIYVGIDSGRGGARIVRLDPTRPYSPYHWELLTQGVVVSTPAIYNGVLYAGSDDGNVYAVDEDRNSPWGALNGVFKTAGAIHGDITAEASGVYVASADSKLYCLDPNNGKIEWQYYAARPLYDSPAVTESSVYINVRGQGVAAINKGEGDFNRKARWIAPETTQFLAEDDRYAFLAGKGNVIVAVDKETGEEKFRSRTRDLVAFAVNTQDGTVYAATKQGRIIAASAVKRHGEVGELVWMELPEAVKAN